MVKRSDINNSKEKNTTQNNTDINMIAVTEQFASNLRTFIDQHDGLTQKNSQKQLTIPQLLFLDF